MKSKFNKLYESILNEYVIKNNNKVISESELRIPNLVKDAIAQFISEYLYDEIGYIDWPDNEPFYYYNDLKNCHKLWKSDPDFNEHYSDPLAVYNEIAGGFVKYDKTSNTVTMNIDQWDIASILDVTEYTKEEFLGMLNQNFNKINGMNFIWVNSSEGINDNELNEKTLEKIKSNIYGFAISGISGLIHKHFDFNLQVNWAEGGNPAIDIKEYNSSFNGVGYVINTIISLRI